MDKKELAMLIAKDLLVAAITHGKHQFMARNAEEALEKLVDHHATLAKKLASTYAAID